MTIIKLKKLSTTSKGKPVHKSGLNEVGIFIWAYYDRNLKILRFTLHKQLFNAYLRKLTMASLSST